MNIYKTNEISSSSESETSYVVDSRYYHTTIKCKRKSLKKTIKLIHGRCVVIYRGTGDLFPIAAKDADRHCYCDFVFVCHDPKPITQNKDIYSIPRSQSAMHDSSVSDDENEIGTHNNNACPKRFVDSNDNQNSPNHAPFLFPSIINDCCNSENTHRFFTANGETLMKTNSLTNPTNEDENLSNYLVVKDFDINIDELINSDEPSSSIVYIPPSSVKSMANNVANKNREIF